MNINSKTTAEELKGYHSYLCGLNSIKLRQQTIKLFNKEVLLWKAELIFIYTYSLYHGKMQFRFYNSVGDYGFTLDERGFTFDIVDWDILNGEYGHKIKDYVHPKFKGVDIEDIASLNLNQNGILYYSEYSSKTNLAKMKLC